MVMGQGTVDAAADLLWELWSKDTKLAELPPECVPVDLEDGWAVQRSLDRHIGQPVGWKVAASSLAGQRVIGVDRPLVGSLHAVQLVEDGCVLPLPTIGVAEAEFVFRLDRGLRAAEAPFTREIVLANIVSVHAGMEVPDSRLAAYPHISAPQLVADFMCARWLVIGPALEGIALAELPYMAVSAGRGADVESEGIGSDVLGDPCDALVWLINEVAGHGMDVVPGAVVTTGACAWIENARARDTVTSTFGNSVSVRVTFADPAGG